MFVWMDCMDGRGGNVWVDAYMCCDEKDVNTSYIDYHFRGSA